MDANVQLFETRYSWWDDTRTEFYVGVWEYAAETWCTWKTEGKVYGQRQGFMVSLVYFI